MDIKRRAARGIAVLAVALAAGHLVQNMGERKAPKPVASAELQQKPTRVETVAAGADAVLPVTAQPQSAAQSAPLPAGPMTSNLVPTLPAPALPTVAPAIAAKPVIAEVPAPAIAAEKPLVADVAATPTDAVPTQTPAVAPPVAVASTACDISLDLMAEPNAMIGITLIAPCQPDQRVVLRQGGLVVTGQTTSTGALFTALPAFETQAIIEASFTDGTKAEAKIAVPDLAALRRFGVQWQGDDAFQVHGFENGANYGEKGHVSAADPHLPTPGLTAAGGFLTLVGDSSTDNPLLAEVYTFPADPAAKPEVVVEAAVTDKTCGRELLAETLTSTGGSVFVTDLTLAMPECDAIGDYLVLKNLVLDLNMAAAN